MTVNRASKWLYSQQPGAEFTVLFLRSYQTIILS